MSGRNSGIPLSSFNKKIQEQIAAQLHPGEWPSNIPLKSGIAFASPAAEKDRLRQNKKGPNKTEAAFALHLRSQHPTGEIYEQAVTLLLANGLRYTPDFFLPCSFVAGDGLNCAPLAYEVKGFMRDDAAAKLKMAARVYPWIRFFLASRRKPYGWQIQEILP